jgi:hexosaminidase
LPRKTKKESAMIPRLLLLIVCAPLLSNCQTTPANNIHLIPQPAVFRTQTGSFLLSSDTRIYYPEGQADWQLAANYLVGLVQANAGYALVSQGLKEKFSSPRSNSVYFLPDPTMVQAEGYVLDVKPAAVLIKAKTAAGAFYAVQTLRQLFPPEFNTPILPPKASPKGGGIAPGKKWPAPACLVQDAPRFAYRGLHLDVGRHFFPVEFIKKYIDLLAQHKLNTFHWHLTEDQGWRIEIKKYPKLQTVAACRKETLVGHYSDQPVKYDGKKYCGYYTQEEVKQVVEYARQRFVTIIPEIEMPGHSRAALAAYPELGCTKGPFETATTWGVFEEVYCPNEKTFQFLDDVLAEVCALFPGPYVHIGGDECPKAAWEKSEFCQQLIKKEGLKDEHELQSYFIRRAEAMLAKRNKKLIGWDEILEGGLAPTATVMSWRGTEGGIAAAKAGHDAIMSPGSHCYFDHYQSDPNTEPLAIGGLTTLERAYSYEPIPAELNAEEAKRILGAQANVWTEYMPNAAQVEYMAYPRVCALAEVVWSPKDKRNWKDFARRMKTHFSRLDALGVNYAKSYFDVAASFSKGRIALSTLDPSLQIRFTTDGKEPGRKSKTYTAPFTITENTTVKAQVFQNDKPMGNVRTVEYLMHKASGKSYKMTRMPDKYNGGDQLGLTNGVTGSLKVWSNWVGLVNHDIDPVIDLGLATAFDRVSTRFLNSKFNSIYPPRSIEVLGSMDGKKFTPLAKQDIPADKLTGNTIETVRLDTKKAKYRYLKLVAKAYGVIPANAPNAGNGAWLFLDEVMVE